MAETPRIFISYCWSSPNHIDWVINLAERLISDKVDVSIDKWDLKEGQDKFNFMEKMVRSPEIDKVLIILDKKYAEKADQRVGGVGTETQIISPKIYADVSQEKFIPIIAERSEEDQPFMPTYLTGRIYIDLSVEENYEENYETLLRNIYKRPAYVKPKLGKVPAYLFEETTISHKASSIVRSFENQLNKNPKRINSIIRDFLDEFYHNFSNCPIKNFSNNIIELGKEICDNINTTTPLRNNFILFFDKLLKSEVEFDIDVVIKFLEKLPLLKYPQDNRSSWSPDEFDNFKFFIHEIFLYLVAVGLKNESYKFVEDLLYSSYFFHEKFSDNREPKKYEVFYNNIETINSYYNQTFSKNFHCPMADLMIKRVPENLNRDNLIDADLLCYYVAVLNNQHWFPMTYVYRTRGKFDLFDRLVSARHFEKVKMLFNVSTPNELKEILIAIQKKDNENNYRRVGYSQSFDSVVPIYKIINYEKLSTVR